MARQTQTQSHSSYSNPRTCNAFALDLYVFACYSFCVFVVILVRPSDKLLLWILQFLSCLSVLCLPRDCVVVAVCDRGFIYGLPVSIISFSPSPKWPSRLSLCPDLLRISQDTVSDVRLRCILLLLCRGFHFLYFPSNGLEKPNGLQFGTVNQEPALSNCSQLIRFASAWLQSLRPTIFAMIFFTVRALWTTKRCAVV